MKKGRGGRRRAVGDNGGAAFISLWICMWEEGREGGEDGEMDSQRDGRRPI